MIPPRPPQATTHVLQHTSAGHRAIMTFDVMQRHFSPGAPFEPFLHAMFGKNEWLMRPMLRALDESLLSGYFEDVADIWNTLFIVRPIDIRRRVDEVMQGVSDPERLMRSLVDRAHRQTRFFITTVVNIDAPDHIYLFRELREVHDFLARCGLVADDELDLPLQTVLAEPAYEVALICRRSE